MLRAARGDGSGRSHRYPVDMPRIRTLEETERLVNELGDAPHDEYIVLDDGRRLDSPEAVRDWLRSITVNDPSSHGDAER